MKALPITAYSTAPVRCPAQRRSNTFATRAATVARSSDCRYAEARNAAAAFLEQHANPLPCVCVCSLIPQLVNSTEGQKFGATSTEQQRNQVCHLPSSTGAVQMV
jgi:hypothetical protein